MISLHLKNLDRYLNEIHNAIVRGHQVAPDDYLNALCEIREILNQQHPESTHKATGGNSEV